MSRQTTAVVLVGPRAFGPWGDSLDQPTHLVRFTENSVPGWQVHPLIGAHGTPEQPTPRGTTATLDGPGGLAEDLVVVIAALVVREPDVLDGLADSIASPDGIRIPENGFDSTLVKLAASTVAEKTRLWLGVLDPACALASPETRQQMREWNIEITGLHWPQD